MKKLLIALSLFGATLTLSSFTSHVYQNVPTENSKKDKAAEIRFDTLTVSLGKFSVKNPVQSCTFNYTNVGTAPLVIHQALASCGCTVPTFTKTPVKPGEKGTVNVQYNGTGKIPGYFQKTITVRSNAKNEVVRLIIEGEMTEE